MVFSEPVLGLFHKYSSNKQQLCPALYLSFSLFTFTFPLACTSLNDTQALRSCGSCVPIRDAGGILVMSVLLAILMKTVTSRLKRLNTLFNNCAQLFFRTSWTCEGRFNGDGGSPIRSDYRFTYRTFKNGETLHSSRRLGYCGDFSLRCRAGRAVSFLELGCPVRMMRRDGSSWSGL